MNPNFPPNYAQPPISFHNQTIPNESNSDSTLLIRHLPEAIPFDILSRLFSHYGALAARPCTSARLKNCAFVDFRDEIAASHAQRQLNGLRFLGKVLSVEKSSKPSEDNKQVGGESEKNTLKPLNQENAQSRDVQEGSKSASQLAAEPIAEKLGINYPFPPHIEYAYPPPDGNILTNILNALIAVPPFYTQVLHLMNKMNIPAPFRMALPTPPLPSTPAPPPPPLPSVTEKPHQGNLSSDESEMETSDEEADNDAEAPKKRIKRVVIVGPGIDKDVSHEAVGLKPATLIPKEIPMIKKKNSVLQIKIVPKKVQHEVLTDNTVKESEKLESTDMPFATIDQIESQKLPPEEILSLPMFKNYAAGNPATVLYIKNLAKDVVLDDFYFIFGSLFGSIDAAKAGLSVKLMQEGRMRGQAFVTFPSVELAHRALNLVNGYVFKGKAMIIQFGRNPAASKTS
ncbi:U11/U12 small nuclear ribonucleoprotein 65 kDa protein-like [Chenopodium quinoa]|uniref:U11/U12 small nuclear ribonucleoprotein 65 kDa protein-like n=1 Tax=Chenopodium quinoa TaxID=63459 RepID=UPI000B7834E6|nr:U11/U12 small nuclear ribonucleoprotein 65 kDa protein-like [Chenopodium quinoa]